MEDKHCKDCPLAEEVLAQLRGLKKALPFEAADIDHLRRHHVRLLCRHTVRKIAMVHDDEHDARIKLSWAETANFNARFDRAYLKTGAPLDASVWWVEDGVV